MKSTYKRPIMKKPETSVPIRITWTDGPEANPKRILLAGRSKSGRTTLALTFPKPIVINIDRGLTAYSNKHVPKIDMPTNTQAYKWMIDLFAAIRKSEEPFDKASFDTLVIDDLTGLSEQYEREVLLFEPPTDKGKTRSDGLFLQDYNIIQNRMISTLTSLRDLPFKYIVVVSSIYQQADSDLEGYFETPQVTGQKFPPRVPSYFDEVYYVEFDNEQQEYAIKIKPIKKFPYAGTKSGIKEAVILSPSFTKLKKYYEGAKK